MENDVSRGRLGITLPNRIQDVLMFTIRCVYILRIYQTSVAQAEKKEIRLLLVPGNHLPKRLITRGFAQPVVKFTPGSKRGVHVRIGQCASPMVNRGLHLTKVLVGRQQRRPAPQVRFYHLVCPKHVQKFFPR